MENRTEIWVLGSESDGADRSIVWNNPNFPNLNDPDILIINLDSLDEHTLRRIDRSRFFFVRDMIFNKFLASSNSIIIYVLSNLHVVRPTKNDKKEPAWKEFRVPEANMVHAEYSNIDLTPIIFKIRQMAQGKNIKILDKDNKFSPYFNNIRSYDRILYDFTLSPSLSNIEPTNPGVRAVIDIYKSQKKARRSLGKDHLEIVTDSFVVDNSRNAIASICYLKIDGYWKSGKVVYLPPCPKLTIQESIDTILRTFGGVGLNESLPDWVYEITLPGMRELETKKNEVERQRKSLDSNSDNIISKMNELQGNYQLLTGRDTPLENAVCNAFKLLGFKEIKKMRSPAKEDWVIKFKSTNRTYEYGIIEVKGSNTRTGQGDLRQCDDWTTDFEKEFEAVAKGIFISNQYRLSPYPKLRNDRFRFEKNEIYFSKHRRICILHSCLLFDTVKEVLSTGDNSYREVVERAIEPTEGVLEKIL